MDVKNGVKNYNIFNDVKFVSLAQGIVKPNYVISKNGIEKTEIHFIFYWNLFWTWQ